MTGKRKGWRRIAKAITGGLIAGAAALNTALVAHAPPLSIVVAVVLALGTFYGVYRVPNR